MKQKNLKTKKFNSEQVELYLIALPFLIWYLLFAYKPLIGLLYAFQDFKPFLGLAKSQWVGFDNFARFFQSGDLALTFKNTLILGLYSLVFEFPFGILLAIMINELRSKRLKNFIQTAIFVPYFVAIVVAAGVIINMLSPSSGVINILLDKMGFEKQYFLVQPEWFRVIFTGMNIWLGSGFNAIIFIAALVGISPEMYEAAKIDGVNNWQKIWKIDIPSILPTIIIMMILRIGGMMNVAFEKVLLLQQPATFETSDIISTYVYRMAFEVNDYGLASAAGLFNSLVAVLLVVSANKFSKKLTETSLW